MFSSVRPEGTSNIRTLTPDKLLAFVVFYVYRSIMKIVKSWNDPIEMFFSIHTFFLWTYIWSCVELFNAIEHETALVGIIIAMDTRPPEKLVMVTNFQHCTWLRPTSCTKICEYQSHQVPWKRCTVGQFSLI